MTVRGEPAYAAAIGAAAAEGDAAAETDAARGFAPIGDRAARVLIVGTLPGRVSLARREYYAQARNAFWPIMGALFGAGPEMPYARRVERLIERRVAVWDVCAAARRRGSLDSAIERSSIVPNDFASFFRTHPRIGVVFLNGGTAESLYERFVLPALGPRAGGIERVRLPSTSPANASFSTARKLEAWRVVLARSLGA